MQLCVHLDSARLYRWHLVLLQALETQDQDICVSFVDTPEPLPTSFTAVLDYDRARSRAVDDRFSTHMRPEAFGSWPRYAGGGYDLMLDLSSASRVRTHPGRVLRPLYDGSYKDYALFHALLEQRAPYLAISDSGSRDHVWAIGLPALEMPWRPGHALDSAASRLIEGLVRTVARIKAGEAPHDEPREQTSFAGRSTIFSAAAGFAASRARRKASRLVEKLSGNAAKWHVAWRKVSGDAPPSAGLLSLADFRILADDGKRYYADPFAYVHEGETHVFIEELPEVTGRGLIAHFMLAPCGTPSPVTPVLETPFHLSYPFVFARDGEIWMMPEASAGGGLDLYRATRFPFAWEKVARLIEGRVHDATLFEHEGTLWIAAGSETLQSSSWDGLSLYAAQKLLGPWMPHAGNPVLVDARAARPAGALWRDAAGQLMRPAQDCSRGYGGALTLRTVTQLNDQGFTEATLGTIAFAPATGILGPHTLNRGGGFEIIDLFARPSALRAGFRG
jgi:hypothetical protein